MTEQTDPFGTRDLNFPETAAVRSAAQRLVSERLLLAVDGERLTQEAQDSDVLR